jgi:hypothetical protein
VDEEIWYRNGSNPLKAITLEDMAKRATKAWSAILIVRNQKEKDIYLGLSMVFGYKMEIVIECDLTEQHRAKFEKFYSFDPIDRAWN